MRTLSIAVFLAFTAASVAAPPAAPRKAAELKIIEQSGKTTLLSSLRGKVVVLEFLSTTCPHCQHASQVMTGLHKELGAKGFQPIGIAAFNNTPDQVKGFVSQFNPSYPIGVMSSEKAIEYLNFSPDDRVMVPQMLVIDRKGMIRAKSPMEGDPNLQDEAKLRALIQTLLKEGTSGGGTTTTKAPAPAPKS